MILCVGETQDQREADRTAGVLEQQVTLGLANVPSDRVGHLSIAYEPVWAIGNAAHHATPEQAGESHATIRRSFCGIYGADRANTLSIAYGGSVKPDNAEAMLNQGGIDGALIGGASLIAEQFIAIARAAIATTRSERDST